MKRKKKNSTKLVQRYRRQGYLKGVNEAFKIARNTASFYNARYEDDRQKGDEDLALKDSDCRFVANCIASAIYDLKK